MKILQFIALFFISITIYAQPNTEVFLVDITRSNGKTQLVNPRNISNNKGYDNQPSFFDDNTVLFSSTRNGQTDIKNYKISSGENSWITNTPLGSEFSPLKIPNQEAISAVRLDKTGLQRLYQYNLADGIFKVLLPDLKVGYHVWFSSTILVLTVLVDDRMDLVVSNLRENTSETIQKNVGRSLHKIPNSNLISFISNENGTSSIKSLDPIAGTIDIITTLPNPIQDICWMTDNIILIPDGKSITQLNIVDDGVSLLHHFEEDEIKGISRIAVSADGKHLALVSEE